MKITEYLPLKLTLFDDSSSDFLNEMFQFNVKGTIVCFHVKEIERNNFKNLKEILSDGEFEKLIQEGQFENSPPSYYLNFMSNTEYFKLKLNSEYYASEPHLGLKYLISNNLIVILTFGEKQPSRWILIVEGVLKIA